MVQGIGADMLDQLADPSQAAPLAARLTIALDGRGMLRDTEQAGQTDTPRYQEGLTRFVSILCAYEDLVRTLKEAS